MRKIFFIFFWSKVEILMVVHNIVHVANNRREDWMPEGGREGRGEGMGERKRGRETEREREKEREREREIEIINYTPLP